jgi:hypothetical protein
MICGDVMVRTVERDNNCGCAHAVARSAIAQVYLLWQHHLVWEQQG